MSSITEIAEIAHEANRTYCKTLGDNSQLSWFECPQWQRDSAINGVKAIIKGTVVVPKDSHANWMKEKLDKGWVYGETKNLGLKTHPCLVPFNQLPYDQRTKDYLFFSITKILLGRAAVHTDDME